MVDETNLNSEKQTLFEIQTESLRKKFKKRRINFYPCVSKVHALETLQSLLCGFIANDDIDMVAYSDSVTLHQLDVYPMVHQLSEEGSFKINNPFERYPDGKLKAFGKQADGKLDLPKDEYVALQKQWLSQLRSTMMADVLIIGANAITQDGDIVSTDGVGNRVAGMIFGPRFVIVVVGRNKLVRNIDQAIERNREVAAPLNYLRHNLKHHSRYNTPCLVTGKCIDCDHPRRACLNTVIISGAVEASKDRIHLLFVNEDLGL